MAKKIESLRKRISLITELMEENKRDVSVDASVANTQLGTQRKRLNDELDELVQKEQEQQQQQDAVDKEAEADRKIQRIQNEMKCAEKAQRHFERQVEHAKEAINEGKRLIEKIKKGEEGEPIQQDQMDFGDMLSMIHDIIKDHR